MRNIIFNNKFIMLSWFVIVLLVFLTVINEHIHKTKTVAKNIIQSALLQDTSFRLWASSHGGVYVRTTEKTPPNKNLSHIQNRDITTKDLNLTLMNPAYMLRQMMEDYSGLYGLKGHITSLKVLNSQHNTPNEWEKKILLDLEKTKNTEIIYEFVTIQDKKYLKAFQPMIVMPSCLKCHAFQGYKAGDIRGGVSMSLPMEELLKIQNNSIYILAIVFIIIYILGFFVIKYFNKRSKQAEQKQLELTNKIKKSERYFKSLFNSSKNITIINDKKTIQDANQAFLDFTGFSSIEEFKNKYSCVCDLFIPENGYLQKTINNVFWLDYIKNHPEEIHKAKMRKDNKTYIFIVYFCECSLDDENLCFTSFNDITELIEKEEMLIAQSRGAAMGEMISMIAHQWRQPLSVISMEVNNIFLDLDLNNEIDKDQLKKTSLSISNQIKYLSQTIDDFKNFFKPVKSKEIVFVEDIIEESLIIIEKSLINHNIRIEKKYKKTSKINIYSKELLQVLINILNNAKDALVDDKIVDPKIFISTFEDQDNVCIKICDNANGISTEIFSKIFEPYFSTKSKINGTGLGLYMSKTIVEKHLNGSIECYNDNGACFLIKLEK